MSNRFEQVEAEAVAMLQAGNPKAWSILVKYFERLYSHEATQCVDCNIEQVKIHQGRARQLRDAANLSADAHKLLSE